VGSRITIFPLAMKKSIFFLFTIVGLSSAGQNISVKESHEKFSTGHQNAATTVIYENKIDDVMEAWKKTLKDYKHEKVKEKDNEVFGDNILIKDWGNNPVDFYAKFDDDRKGRTVKMMVAVDLGGTYLSSSEDKAKYKYLEKMVKDFAVRMTKEPLQDAVKEQSKVLAKMEDKQKDLEKDRKNLAEDIVGFKNKINKAEKELAEKNAALDKKKNEVDVQKKVVDASSDAVSEQAKSSRKIYEKLADQQKDIEKDIKDLHNDVKNYQEKIKTAEREIKNNEESQEKKKTEIAEQKKVVEDWKKKLENVN
jgi:septal ring factor EnvC (AmiA/AmiB activator)